MRTLYLDCGMGASGDMLTGALLELLPEPADFVRRFNERGIPDVAMAAEPDEKCGLRGTHVTVTVHGHEESEPCHGHDHSHHHAHHGMAEIERIFSQLALPERVRAEALAVYRLLAEAESAAHGVPVSEIHFHEVGELDAIADVTAVCMLIDELRPERILASPVHVGSGTVCCAHGVLSVPAPAAAELLRGIPIYGGSVAGELCTPTGAALLRHFVTEFGDMPVLRVEKIGCGTGKKDFPRANCLRAFWGETEEAPETVTELQCNIDDMTGEALGFATEELLRAGALEVFTLPAGMKKSRPGTLLVVLCAGEKREEMVRAMLKHTTTLGVRERTCRRWSLAREVRTVETPFGAVRRKDSAGFGICRSKYEYEDIARLARERGESFGQVLAKILLSEDGRAL